jgi:uncharacterized protein YwgA
MRKMVSVTPLESAIDRFLLLYSISKASECVENLGDTKLQKFIFLSEWEMIDKHERGFCYYYLKYEKGPYSFDLANDIKIFLKTDILRKQQWDISLTKFGKRIVQDFSGLVDQNPRAVSIIQGIIDKYAGYSLQELLDVVYSLPHPYVRGYTIRTASLKMPLLYKLPEEKVVVPFTVNKEEVEDLLVSLSKNGLKHWQAVREDMRKPEYLTYKEVFGSVRI